MAFDIKKDLLRYRGIPPYASELYGVYQPLLGWTSNLTKRWLLRGGISIDPEVQRILNGRIQPGPTRTLPDFTPQVGSVDPLTPGTPISPYRVLIAKDLQSELVGLMRIMVQQWVDVSSHNGQLPDGNVWQVIVTKLDLTSPTGALKTVNDRHRQHLLDRAIAFAPNRQLDDAARERVRQQHLKIMRYESQIAGFLKQLSDTEPNELKKLFFVKEAAPLADILRPTDPLSTIDPTQDKGALSPLGMMHLFRQYFFDLGTFLGEPVEHIWLSPGTTTELVEVSTRRTLIERQVEEAVEMTSRSESASTRKDELSDAVSDENSNSTKLGISQSNNVKLSVYQGNVSGSFGVESTRRQSREIAYKQTREQTDKLSSELKRSFKSTMRVVSEATDMRSRRYVIQNQTGELLNFEIRRKMRRVGVQVQDIGSRLCWQFFIDDPGRALGLSELVHFAQPPDLANLKQPERPAALAKVTKRVAVPLGFKPVLNYYNNKLTYELEGPDAATGVNLGRVRSDPDDDDSQIVMEFKAFKFDPPQIDYLMTADIRVAGVQGGKLAEVANVIANEAAQTFDILMRRVNFGGENVINLDVDIVFKPSEAAEKKAQEDYNKQVADYNVERDRLLRKTFMEEVRQRIKAASAIRARPAWDLREEERTIVYRGLLEKLMLDSWKIPQTSDDKRIAHLRSELIRSIFDVDAMLYFVAPEWWRPRKSPAQLNIGAAVEGQSFTLAEDEAILWGGERRPENYKITEESEPARLGSSLGWLLQLDGDNLRNAFLNAPWVKAVLPVRPGKETAALNWLSKVEGIDGWSVPYAGTANEDVEFTSAGMTIEQVLKEVAKRLEKQNTDTDFVLAPDTVFETGFSAIQKSFSAGLDANQVFSQSICIVPTDQLVATPYQSTDLLVPGQ